MAHRRQGEWTIDITGSCVLVEPGDCTEYRLERTEYCQGQTSRKGQLVAHPTCLHVVGSSLEWGALPCIIWQLSASRAQGRWVNRVIRATLRMTCGNGGSERVQAGRKNADEDRDTLVMGVNGLMHPPEQNMTGGQNPETPPDLMPGTRDKVKRGDTPWWYRLQSVSPEPGCGGSTTGPAAEQHQSPAGLHQRVEHGGSESKAVPFVLRLDASVRFRQDLEISSRSCSSTSTRCVPTNTSSQASGMLRCGHAEQD